MTDFGVTPVESEIRAGGVQYPLSKCKVVMLGEHNVGKTSISACFMRQPFESVYSPTIGIDFTARNIDLGDACIRLQVWDTAGQERFRSLVPSYIKDCSAALLVYDVTKMESFEAVESWVKQIMRYSDIESVVIALVGNKVDLAEETSQKRQIDVEVGQKMADEIGAAFFCETSAKTAHNIQYLFHKVAELCHNRRKASFGNGKENGNGHVSVDLQAEVPVEAGNTGGLCCR